MGDIRAIRQQDVAACVDLVHKNWGKKIARRFEVEVHHAFNPTLAWPPEYFVYVRSEGNILGFAGMHQSWIMHGVWDLIWINVDPNFQSSGIGTALTKARLKHIQGCKGTAVHLMTKNIKFFKKFDFKVSRKYGDWNLMTKQLRKVHL